MKHLSRSYSAPLRITRRVRRLSGWFTTIATTSIATTFTLPLSTLPKDLKEDVNQGYQVGQGMRLSPLRPSTVPRYRFGDVPPDLGLADTRFNSYSYTLILLERCKLHYPCMTPSCSLQGQFKREN